MSYGFVSLGFETAHLYYSCIQLFHVLGNTYLGVSSSFRQLVGSLRMNGIQISDHLSEL